MGLGYMVAEVEAEQKYWIGVVVSEVAPDDGLLGSKRIRGDCLKVEEKEVVLKILWPFPWPLPRPLSLDEPGAQQHICRNWARRRPFWSWKLAKWYANRMARHWRWTRPRVQAIRVRRSWMFVLESRRRWRRAAC